MSESYNIAVFVLAAVPAACAVKIGLDSAIDYVSSREIYRRLSHRTRSQISSPSLIEHLANEAKRTAAAVTGGLFLSQEQWTKLVRERPYYGYLRLANSEPMPPELESFIDKQS